MKQILSFLFIVTFISGILVSCGGTEQSKEGLSKEQQESIDKDKKDFERKLPDYNRKN